MKHLTLAVLASGQLAFGSGWMCQSLAHKSTPYTFRLKLYNHTDATRLPHILIVSEKELGTVSRAEDEEIEKTIMGLETIYTAKVKDADKLHKTMGWELVEFTIPYREGVDKPLKYGEVINGELALEGNRETTIVPLRCARYLKGGE
jgi:hypothetical protein